MYRPRLVSYIDNLRSGERRHVEPALLSRIPLKPENVEFVKRAMAGVNKEGTGARSFGSALYTNGGKTGTAQVIGMKQGEKYDEKRVREHLRDHALFIAYAPAEAPRIALAILVENGGHGGATAGPIAREVLDFYLLGKLPEKKVPLGVDEDEHD
jgi:penicillin-binding protein 2